MKLYCKREWEADIPDEKIVKAVDSFARQHYAYFYSKMNRADVQSLAEYLVEITTGYDKYPNEFTKPLRTRIREIIAQRIEVTENPDDQTLV